MDLGDLIVSLEREEDAALALERLGDLTLFAEVAEVGAAFDETPGAYLANAVRRHASLATSEDWLALMTAMERSPEPGRAALAGMLRWSLARDREELSPPPPSSSGCGCGSGGCGGEGHGHP